MNEPGAICTLLIIVLTSFCSFLGFRDPVFTEKFLFSITEILACKQYYRLFTSAFLHADFRHLLMNMITLYFFGSAIELFLGPVRFLAIYFAAVVGGGLLSLWLHRHHDYRAYGASGGTCGMIFSFIALFPEGTINLHFIFPVPAWLYAILFLIGSLFGLKRQADNIGHDAHIGGAIVGLWTTAALQPWAVQQNLKWFVIISGMSLALFIYLVKNPMLLPMSSFLPEWPRRKQKSRVLPEYQREPLEVDAVLEKISRNGVESLTPEEKALLERVSGKYQSRAQSEKPKSDLII